MTDEGPDWTTELPLGDDGVRTSTRRQLGVIVAIVVATIALLAGLVVAGAAVLHVVTDRATQHSKSYDFGHDLAEKARDVVTQIDLSQDWDHTCQLLMSDPSLTTGRPEPFELSDAVAGCTDTLSS